MSADTNLSSRPLAPASPARAMGRTLWLRTVARARGLRLRLQGERARLGAKWSVVLLILPLVAFGALHFGPRAGLVTALTTASCVGANVALRRLLGEPFRWLNPGTVVTGLLLSLTLSADTPLYMLPVGAVVAEIFGKYPVPGLRRSLLNPAALGRGAIAVLETIDPTLLPDIITSASPLMVVSGGHGAPSIFAELLLGLTKGAIGETNKLLLLFVGLPLLTFVALKRDAAYALLVSVPVYVALLPATPAIDGHAPWAMNPLVYLLGGSTLMMAFFFCTDPVTTPKTRLGGWIFGAGAGLVGVLGRLYTTIPGCEMWGVLVMNAATPGIDWAVARWSARGARPTDTPKRCVVGPAEVRLVEAADVTSALPEALAGRVNEQPFSVLREVLVSAMPGEIWREVQRSELTGYGGAHFPVATKWQLARKYPGPRILVINGQEGEPETFKDHYLMLRAPHLVLEGAAIAAFALEAEVVHIVIDPKATPELAAMERALGELIDAFGKSAETRFKIVRGPGAYVAGEESALLEFLEGRRIEPRLRPPFPAEKGLFGRPTVVHNVETVAWLPGIVREGGAAFKAKGPLKLVSLSGAVKSPGVYAVPLGTRLGEVLHVGGGMAAGQTLLALGVGGPAGGLLPPSALDLPLRDRELQEAGAALGTAAIRVFAVGQCLLHETLETLAFFERESCGRCAPCRIGTQVMRRSCSTLASGGGSEQLIQQLDATSDALVAGSFCGLGRGVPTRLRSLHRYWPEVVRRHAAGEECPTCRSRRG